MFSANHFCSRGISVSGSKQIRIRGFATMKPAVAADGAIEDTIDEAATASGVGEDVDVCGGSGGGGCRSNDGGAKFRSNAVVLVSPPQMADDSRSFGGGELTSREKDGIYKDRSRAKLAESSFQLERAAGSYQNSPSVTRKWQFQSQTAPLRHSTDSTQKENLMYFTTQMMGAS